MKPTFFKGVALGAATCFVMLVGTAALAGTGVGGIFNLGQTNAVDGTSILTGIVDGNPELTVNNRGSGPGIRALSTGGRGLFGQHNSTTGTLAGVEGATLSTDPNAVALRGNNTGGGSALELVVTSNAVPPLKVNSSGKVASLNADLLDGKDVSDFYAAGSKVADSDKLDGKDSTGFYAAGSKVADSDMLDGKDSASFQSACAKGAAWAYGLVRGSSSFSTSYTPVYSWNCKASSGKLQVKRLGTGRYRVLLATGYCLFDPIVVGAVVGDADNFFSYTAPLDSSGCVEGFNSSIVDVTTPNAGGNLQDRTFVLVWLGA